MDEYEIKATGEGMEDRIWTRDKLSSSKKVAEGAIAKLGYSKAEVFNTFGGHRGWSLYTVTPTEIIDHLAKTETK